MLNEFKRLTGQDKINESSISENDFIPGLSDSDYGLEANVVATKLTKRDGGNQDALYNTILNNKDVVSIISKLDNPEVVNMIKILKENQDQLKRLTNTL
tara:strand:+ start:19181 stop:19477 length:297 start_codon:yes stop_codon:yes gene_type:complete